MVSIASSVIYVLLCMVWIISTVLWTFIGPEEVDYFAVASFVMLLLCQEVVFPRLAVPAPLAVHAMFITLAVVFGARLVLLGVYGFNFGGYHRWWLIKSVVTWFMHFVLALGQFAYCARVFSLRNGHTTLAATTSLTG